MENSWLVQRLQEPRGYNNPFSFGGGLKNGGLSDDAMDLSRNIFSFDYMGSAEFEFGAVPKAFNKLVKSALYTSSVSVPLSEIPANWRDQSGVVPVGNATIYILCPAADLPEVEARVGAWARKEPRLKGGLRLSSSLRPFEKWDTDVCGWLELDNGFMFFTNKEMWEKTCSLFGVTT